MATEITVPTLGESVTEATVAKWFKAKGDAVAVDEPILEREVGAAKFGANDSLLESGSHRGHLFQRYALHGLE